uniref:Putative ribonuclease H-like domain-containing protein n=1 Tax=Tanacetum cinerariifolium TaxID=118510 RepID=A0A6L2KLD3_TANCI|nr:putative ribonuclease H-like domain-containing protein [Tanacetum cinerariifolium]
MNYKLVVARNQSNGSAGTKAYDNVGKTRVETIPDKDYILLPLWTQDPLFSSSSKDYPSAGFKPSGEEEKKDAKDLRNKYSKVPSIEEPRVNQENDANVNSINNINTVSPTNNVAGINDNVVDENIVYGYVDDPNMPDLEEISIFGDAENDDSGADMNNLDTYFQVSLVPTTRIHKDHLLEQVIRDMHSAPQTRRMSKNLEGYGLGHTHKEGIDYDKVFTPVARIKAIRLFQAYASFKDFVEYQMDVKSAFLYGKIEEEVYVFHPPGFEEPDFPDKVYKVEKELYGLHQAPKAWYETLSTYFLDNGFQRGMIDKTSFLKRDKSDILLVQVYVDDIIFRSTRMEMCTVFEKMMHKKVQMSSIRELTCFLGLQVKMKKDRIFISQDKSMIGSLMYPTSSRPDIMFAPTESAKFEQIVNFLNNPTIYTSCIEQFWTTAKAKNINGEAQIHAKVDGKKVVLSEALIRRELQFGDEGGINCLPNKTIFEQLLLMGYEKHTQKLTFYKAFFCPQWKFLIYTILQCLSAKTTAWNEFSSTIASVVICLATDQKLKFSKYIFDSMVKNLDSATKFLMFPRFVQVFFNNQLEEMANHTRIYVLPSYTKKIFGNIKRVGKGFSGMDTPLFPTMMVQAQEELRKESSANEESLDEDKDIFGVNDQNDTLMFDADKDLQEFAFKLQAIEDEHERIIREKSQQIKEVNLVWDDVQAKIKADYEMAQRLQAEEQEQLTYAEKARLFMEFLEKRRNSKRAKDELEQEIAKKQRIKDENESTELKRCLEIVLDDVDDVTIDATPLSSKSPTIVDYKIYKEGRKNFFQIIRADGNSQMYLTFNKMLKNFDREDLEVLWRLVKDIFVKTKPVDDMDSFLLHTLKTMFKHHVEDNVWRNQQGLVKVKN